MNTRKGVRNIKVRKAQYLPSRRPQLVGKALTFSDVCMLAPHRKRQGRGFLPALGRAGRVTTPDPSRITRGSPGKQRRRNASSREF